MFEGWSMDVRVSHVFLSCNGISLPYTYVHSSLYQSGVITADTTVSTCTPTTATNFLRWSPSTAFCVCVGTESVGTGKMLWQYSGWWNRQRGQVRRLSVKAKLVNCAEILRWLSSLPILCRSNSGGGRFLISFGYRDCCFVTIQCGAELKMN